MTDDTSFEVDGTELDAVIFDMDGVVTRTATLHAEAWKALFDPILEQQSPPSRPFDTGADYLDYVDGKPRSEGVASFLASRGITVPWGEPGDPPGTMTVCGLGNQKNVYYQQLLADRGVEVFGSTVELIGRLRAEGIKTGVFSASRHARDVLAAANVLDHFDAIFDGLDAERLKLPGKPHPATLVTLAQRLRVAPGRTAVVEDSTAGIEAGRAGGFALVIGVNRSGETGRLLNSGADIEVRDLAELRVGRTPTQGSESNVTR